MNISDILLGLAVALVLFLSFRAAWRRRGKCSCGCGGCGGCPGCGHKQQEEQG